MFYPHGGGAELATYLYAKLLSERGFNIVVVTNRFNGEPAVSETGNLTVYRLSLFKESSSVKYSILFRSGYLLSGFIRKLVKWADLVYIPRFWFPAIILAKACKKPVVTHLHDYIPVCPLSNLYDVSEETICTHKGAFCSPKCVYVYERTSRRSLKEVLYSVLLNSALGSYFHRIVALSDAIVCVSTAQRNLIVSNHADLVAKIHVVYNPLPNTSPAKVRGNDFGFFGGPGHMKGFHVLRKAATIVKTVKPVMIHATKFPDANNHSVSLSDLGILTYGKLNKEEYETLYTQIRTVVVPSVWAEPLPYVVSEAAMSGRIVIASSVGGIPEQAAGCEGVFLFEPGDYKALAERVLFVAGLSEKECVELGMKNREFLAERFNNEKIVDEFCRLLETVVDRYAEG